MKAFLLALAVSAGLGMVVAQAQTAAPVTATCKDGTTFSGKKRSGACRGHGGVEAFDTTPATAAPAAPATPAAAPAAPAPAPTPSVTASRPQTQSTPQSGTTSSPGGNGQVWVNTSSHVYHCPGTQWYGKTKKGEYMTEAEAKSVGDRPDHGKTCS